MDCALRLRDGHRLDPQAIREVRCRTAQGPVPRLWEPLASKHAPKNGYAAKFSLPYLLALMLVKGGAGLADFTDEAVHDESVLRVARLVFYDIDPAIDYPRRFIGDVRVRLASGQELVERQEHPRGGPDHPMTRGELETKFEANARLFLDAARSEQVLRGLRTLETLPRLSGLVEVLSPGRRGRRRQR